jgi:hypothetical protein
VTTPQPGESHRWPWFLPDGKHFLYVDTILGAGRGTLRLASLETRDRRALAEVDSNAIWSQGYLLFVKGGMLMAQPFDLKHLETTGDASTIADGIRHDIIGVVGAFCASANGLLAYEGDFSNLRLTWFDRKGNPAGSFGESAQYTNVQLSPSRRKVAIAEFDTGFPHIWIYDTLQGLRTRFTFDQASENFPVWSPDGRVIVFSSNRGGDFDLYRKPAEGSGRAELVYADKLLKNGLSFTPDAKYFLYWTTGDPQTGIDLWILPEPLGAAARSKPFPFAQTRFTEALGQFSPDGRWIAYTSDESGQFEIYVAPFPGPGPRRQVSVAGGYYSRWRSDGKELYYIGLNNELMATAAPVGASGGFESGKVEPLFPMLITGIGLYDVSADGQRFLGVAPQQTAKGETLSVVQNWTAGLRR